MHELGMVMEVVRTVEAFVADHGLTQVDTVVLQVGEDSAVVPQYLHACFPAAVDRTSLKNTKLRIEVVPGKGFVIKEIVAC